MGQERIGLVLGAGGARGAYQAGVLAVLLPILDARGERPTILTGASVGALNAAQVAASAHLDVDEQVARILVGTRTIKKDRVLRPLWQQMPLVAMRYGAETLDVRISRLRGLLGTEPLARTLRTAVDWPQLHHNITEGLVASVTAIATVVETGRVVAFVEGADHGPLPTTDGIDYVTATLDVPHLMASAAIPMLFPPIRVDAPPGAAAWYVDGSTRLHTPLKPALDLGAERLAVIGTASLRPRAAARGDDDAGATGRVDRPRVADVDLGDGAVTLLNAMIEDSMRRDLRHLGEVNALLGEAATRKAARRWRDAIGATDYRQVPFLAIAPDDPDELSRLAMEVYHANHHGLRGLRDPDFQLMHRILGSDSPLQGELLSYLLFDPDYIEELVRLGRRDARRWMATNPDDPWRLDPLPLTERREA